MFKPMYGYYMGMPRSSLYMGITVYGVCSGQVHIWALHRHAQVKLILLYGRVLYGYYILHIMGIIWVYNICPYNILVNTGRHECTDHIVDLPSCLSISSFDPESIARGETLFPSHLCSSLYQFYKWYRSQNETSKSKRDAIQTGTNNTVGIVSYRKEALYAKSLDYIS